MQGEHWRKAQDSILTTKLESKMEKAYLFPFAFGHEQQEGCHPMLAANLVPNRVSFGEIK